MASAAKTIGASGKYLRGLPFIPPDFHKPCPTHRVWSRSAQIPRAASKGHLLLVVRYYAVHHVESVKHGLKEQRELFEMSNLLKRPVSETIVERPRHIAAIAVLSSLFTGA